VRTNNGRVTKDGIRIYEPSGFAGMHAAGALAAKILDDIAEHVFPGQTTGVLDGLITQWVEDAGAVSATIGYKGYQHASCISVNHVVCHGIPGEKALKDGDILNIDVTVIVDGWFGDTSRMYVAGKLGRKAERLIEVTHDALMKGIEAANGRAGTGAVLEEGMFFTIEPMINLGRPETKVLADDWTAVTRDKSLSAQFEHSIGITADGCDIFTLSPKGMFHPTYG